MSECDNDHHRHDETRLERMEEKMDLLMTWVGGNGDPRRGLLARVHRVELIVSALLFIGGGIATGLIAVAVTKIWGA
jgi:hypothetical protein